MGRVPARRTPHRSEVRTEKPVRTVPSSGYFSAKLAALACFAQFAQLRSKCVVIPLQYNPAVSRLRVPRSATACIAFSRFAAGCADDGDLPVLRVRENPLPKR